jgi:L-fuculose-phosphate aldolase
VGAIGNLSSERRELAAACGRLAARGLVIGTQGNVSVRRDELVAITPTGAALAELEPQQVAVVDLDGRPVGSGLEPASELALHLAIYRRYRSGAVVHTHAPVATALSLVLDELPCVHYEMVALGGSVRVAPYATFGTPELAAAVVEALDGRAAALMANHGAVVHAADLPQAEALAELLEWACTLYWRAAAIGTPRTLDAAAQAAFAAERDRRGYGAPRPAR